MLFRSPEGPEGEMGICSVEQDKISPIEMLNAMKPYGTKQEQDLFDVLINLIQGFQLRRNYQETAPVQENNTSSPSLMLEKLKNILSPEQQSRLENIQLMMQSLQAFT